VSNKAKEAAEVIVNENGATLREVLGAILKLSPGAVKRVKRKSAPKRKGAKR